MRAGRGRAARGLVRRAPGSTPRRPQTLRPALRPTRLASRMGGRLTHCGVPVTCGTRYLLVLFLLATTEPLLAGRLQARC